MVDLLNEIVMVSMEEDPDTSLVPTIFLKDI